MMARLTGLWEVHRSFLVALAAGLLGLSIGLTAVSSIEGDAARLGRRNRLRARDIEALAATLRGREGLARGIAEALHGSVGPEVLGSLEMRGREGFVLREGETEGIVHFQALKRVKAAVETAVKDGVSFPKRLGFDELPPAGRTSEQLALLDAGERVIGAVRSLGLQAVTSFAPGTARYEPVGTPAAEGAEGDAARAKPLFLRRLPLRLDVRGPLGSAERLISWFQRPGAFFEVTSLAIERTRDDAIRLQVEVWALSLLEQSEVPRGAVSARGAGKTRGRRLRSRRSRRARR